MKRLSNVHTCSVCNTIYSTKELSDACEKSHDVVYVAFDREDLFKLIQFIITKDDSLISEKLVRSLQKYKRGEYK